MRCAHAPIIAAALLATSPLFGGAPARAAANVIPRNAIVVENRHIGCRCWEPLAPTGPVHAIEGYAGETSLLPGEVLHLHVRTSPSAAYQVQFFRLGFYGGKGGRIVACVPGCSKSLRGSPRPIPAPDPQTGRLALTWPATAAFRIPKTWPTGYYVAKLMLATHPSAWPVMGNSAVVPFVVREAPGGGPSKILVISDFNTEQAYNNWGGKSLYDFNSGGAAATKVSFDRPYAGEVWHYETTLLGFLEQQPGLDVSYATDVDVDQHPTELLRHKLILVVGHNEYWSGRMRDAYENARNHGVNLAFFGGNYGDWQIRYENSGRTIVEYRSAASDPNPDPVQKTTKFGQLTPARPQCQLLGTQFSNQVSGLPGNFRVVASALGDPWFAGTGFHAGDTFHSFAGEGDVSAPAGCIPYTLTTFFTSAVRPTFAPAVRYHAPSGATVFAAGSLALATDGLNDKRVRRFALNALASMSR
jgi:hypothetical protein